MEAYKAYLKNEVEELRAKGKAFLNGDVTRVELRGFSGGFGCYAQREDGKFMIRMRTPSGLVSRKHFKKLLEYAKNSGLEKIHLTTRQAVQIHDLSIDEVCDIMKDAIDYDLFTRGGGGNFPRNVALSPMAGVDPKEVFDVTPYAIQVGNYFLKNATTYKLPRKLKVAFSSSASDTAGATVNDMGFIGVLDTDGKPMFRMWLAGGMGSNPASGVLYDTLVEPTEVLYYIEAMVQMFMAEGDYTNKAKARIRYIMKRLGTDAFFECYKKHLEAVRQTHNFEGIVPVLASKNEHLPKNDHAFILAQRQPEKFTAVLHPMCGQLMLKDGERIEKLLEAIPEAELRLSMDEALYVRNLTKAQAQTLISDMKEHMMMTRLSTSVSCVGTPTCEIGMNHSQKLCYEVLKAVRDAGANENRLPQMYVSGCPNCCTRHAAAALGFAGRMLRIDDTSKEAFDCYVGGCIDMEHTRIVEKCGTILADRIPEMMVELAQMLEKEDKTYPESVIDGSAMAVIEKYFVA